VKKTIGSPRKRPITLAPPNDLLGLAICEGIEDALTAHAATGLGAWASASAGFMPGLANSVPSYINAVTIFAHADKAGQDGACKLAPALRARGIETTLEGLSPIPISTIRLASMDLTKSGPGMIERTRKARQIAATRWSSMSMISSPICRSTILFSYRRASRGRA